MDRVDLEPAGRLHEGRPWAPARKKFDFSEKSNFWTKVQRRQRRMARDAMSANAAIEWTESTGRPRRRSGKEIDWILPTGASYLMNRSMNCDSSPAPAYANSTMRMVLPAMQASRK